MANNSRASKQRFIACSTVALMGLCFGTNATAQFLQDFFGTTVTVVNMIPRTLSGESNQDSEPNIAVNPNNPLHIAGSAFTPNPMEESMFRLARHARHTRSINLGIGVPEFDDDDIGGDDILPGGEGLRAPIYVSLDGGQTWTLNPTIEHASQKHPTRDITLRFSDRGNRLYAAYLKGTSEFPAYFKGSADFNCPTLDSSADDTDEIFVKPELCVPLRGPEMEIARTEDFASDDVMTKFFGDSGMFVDQPYVQVATAVGRDGQDEDRVLVGNNNLNYSKILFPGSLEADSRTASVAQSPAGNKGSFGLFTNKVIEPNSPLYGQNGSGVRVAVHRGGTVYGIFYHLTGVLSASPLASRLRANVVVVRDDNWALSQNPFQSLVGPQRGTIGKEVAVIRTLPLRRTQLNDDEDLCEGPLPDMGQERLVASDLSIAVHPRNRDIVYVAWADAERTIEDSYRLHVRRSVDAGQTWSQDLLVVGKAKNPALAINRAGNVGFLYQAFEQSEEGRRWVTHFRQTGNTDSWSDKVLANVPADTPVCQFRPYIGDYVHLMAVGFDFYGVFSANNDPDPDNFPNGVTYQRYVHSDGTLRASPASPVVPPSIDPFFFKVTNPWVPEMELELHRDF